jgi:ribosome-binding protein aMBF1 (putative translation factor)
VGRATSVECFATRDAAEAEERRLIEANAPAYNVMHNHLEREKRNQRLRRKVHGPDAAEILKRARRLAGLTQQDLALRLGTSQQTISVYETSRKQPMMSTLTRLLAGCGLEMRIQLVPTTDE